MHKPKLFLIDANSFCYRAFFAIRELVTSYGQPTNAIYGFVNMLRRILQEERPDYIGICFDVSKDTFRKQRFTDYKVNRPSMPDALVTQMPVIKEIISAYNLSIFESEGYEADDLIATISKQAVVKDLDVFIATSDKDILQLVDKNIKVYNPTKNEEKIYDRKEVKSRYGVEPKNIVDLIALMGDKTDNIPGVSGIGENTAVQLIEQFGNFKKIYTNLNKIKSERLRKALEQQRANALLSKELATLDEDVPIKIDLETLKLREPDYGRLFKLFRDLEFKSLLKDLPQNQFKSKTAKLISIDKKEELNKFEKRLMKEKKDFSFFISTIDTDNRLPEVKEAFFCYKKDEVIAIKNLKSIKSILENPNTEKITYNFKKTMFVLANKNINVKGRMFDVMIAAYLLDPSKTGYSIEDMTLQYLGLPVLDNQGQKQENANLIFRLKSILEDKLKEKSLDQLFYTVEMPLISVLAKMEMKGVKIDEQFLKELSKSLEKRMIELIKEIYNVAGVEFNINSPKQLRGVLFEKLKLPVIKRTKTGPSTDEEVLRRLSKQHNLPKLILEYRQLVKLKSTYIDALPKLINPKTANVHTSFNQTGTETGRLASSEPNLQNLPIKTELGRQIRRAIIISQPDYCLLSADYSQIELRVLAHLSEDKNLISAFKKGEDIHKFTASLVYNQSREDISDQMRDVAKRVNFGIIYGISSYGLSKDLDISHEEAQSFIDAYFLRYPKVKDYMQKQINKARKDGFIVTLLGRRRYIPQINSKNSSIRQFAERQAINTPVQGTAADLIKLAMIKLQEELEKRKLDSKLILQVHDELVFEIPKKELSDMKTLVKDIMENAIKLSVPILVSIKVGRNWLDMEEVK